ncbi:hypothetical protein A8F94_01495 [Bacillus sp. FJAT-27225]|uniref:VanZ family protein n=1 Tax=Bacillus sp. FJAT-27225 TaxID=1743144 RepID=UPI00080C2B7A|nr:VanZ family protein [Bacillus sp. FJAT-27225]OCA90584.1 hypothetical protein A8F94_01495 [Bacillus sp. FJAT-27225]
MTRLFRTLIYISFAGYLSILFYLLFFSAYRNGVRGELNYNVIPFATIAGYFKGFQRMSPTDQFAGNILAFIPFGVFLSFLLQKWANTLRIAALSFSLSMLAELAQITFRIGAFDVDDLLLNTLGGIIGYLLMKRGLTLTP